MKVLNLYSGIGGNRKLWTDVEVTAIEINPKAAELYQEYFPEDKVIVTDAHEYLLNYYNQFDFIWSSPPCQTHTVINKMFVGVKKSNFVPRYPDMKLYQEIIFLENFFKGKYCVENVSPYYNPLIPAQKAGRHLIWSNFKIPGSWKDEQSIGMLEHDDDRMIAERYGFEYKRPLYLNTHSKAQAWRNCVNPKLGKLILDHARGIIEKSNLTQLELL